MPYIHIIDTSTHALTNVLVGTYVFIIISHY